MYFNCYLHLASAYNINNDKKEGETEKLVYVNVLNQIGVSVLVSSEGKVIVENKPKAREKQG